MGLRDTNLNDSIVDMLEIDYIVNNTYPHVVTEVSLFVDNCNHTNVILLVSPIRHNNIYFLEKVFETMSCLNERICH